MEIERKLAILADAAKYDASCSSSGGERRWADGFKSRWDSEGTRDSMSLLAPPITNWFAVLLVADLGGFGFLEKRELFVGFRLVYIEFAKNQIRDDQVFKASGFDLDCAVTIRFANKT